MQTLNALGRRIDRTQDMRSVVSTMKTLAAVSIRQYEEAVDSLADYDRTIQLGFQILLRDRGAALRAASSTPDANAGAVVFGSDQGMCGQFNEEIAGFALRRMKVQPEGASWSVLAIGARVYSRLEDAGVAIEQVFAVPVSVSDITRLVQDLLPAIQRWQSEQAIGRLVLFFNRRESASTYSPQQLQLLPLPPDQLDSLRRDPWPSRCLPKYRMPWRDLFSAVVRQYLFVALYRACAESLASENSSRIASMQAAEKNIEQRLAELRTAFNQLRQTAITEELLDVVTGFEALGGEGR